MFRMFRHIRGSDGGESRAGDVRDLMLSYSRLVEAITARDIKVTVVDGRLRVDAPRGEVTPPIAEALRAHKARLLRPAGTSYTIRTKTRAGKIHERTVSHVWCPCDQCGQAVLLDPSRPARWQARLAPLLPDPRMRRPPPPGRRRHHDR